jgi:release factor glutamine methyltransferase
LSRDPVADAARRLAEAGSESARLDARLLWQFAQVVEASAFVARGRAETLFESLVARRLAYEPLAYILGRKEFWSLDFAVGPGALIPRPDSETLIEALRKAVPDKRTPLSVLDLGTGSGCLLIAALSEYPNARGVGIDSSARALDWARQNIEAHKLEARATVIESGWLEEASPGFDAILCNPPYIATVRIEELAPDVKLFEPHSALDGGPDGLDAYRALAPRIGKLLATGGRAFVEIGDGQEAGVRRILEGGKMVVLEVSADLASVPRCLTAAYMPAS